MYFLNADFTSSNVTTRSAEVLHASERQLTQVTVLHSRTNQRHRDVPNNVTVHMYVRNIIFLKHGKAARNDLFYAEARLNKHQT